MIKTFNTGEFRTNGSRVINDFDGEILKIVVFGENSLPNVKVKMETVDGETLIEDYLISETTRFYPKNLITLTQEQVFIENYYVKGQINITIEGIGDDEVIENIIIYYK